MCTDTLHVVHQAEGHLSPQRPGLIDTSRCSFTAESGLHSTGPQKRFGGQRFKAAVQLCALADKCAEACRIPVPTLEDCKDRDGASLPAETCSIEVLLHRLAGPSSRT